MIYLLRRLIAFPLLVIMTMLVTFILLHTVPGGPFDQERELPPEIKENLYRHYGLSPRGEQNFVQWVKADIFAYTKFLARGELGPSLKYRDRDVTDMLAQSAGPTLTLGIFAFALSLVTGITLGLLSTSSKKAARVIGLFKNITVSIPPFILASLLVLIFSHILKWLPPALFESPLHALMPIMTLSLFPMIIFLEHTRHGIEDEQSKDYVRTARAKGLSEGQVVKTHILRNVATPLVSAGVTILIYLIGGSFVVETVFAIPGMGRQFVSAVIDRDYFYVMGATLVYTTIVMGASLLGDLIMTKMDPRIRT